MPHDESQEALHQERERLRVMLTSIGDAVITTDTDGGLDDFSSQHSGGVHLLFADGSVRFIKSITFDGPLRKAFWAMGTRAGNERVRRPRRWR